jgi:hypothetical protein
MSVWENGNEIEVIANKIDCIAKVVELVAEKISTDLESSALWAVVDALQHQLSKLYTISENLCAHQEDKEDDEEDDSDEVLGALIAVIRASLDKDEENDKS